MRRVNAATIRVVSQYSVSILTQKKVGGREVYEVTWHSKNPKHELKLIKKAQKFIHDNFQVDVKGSKWK